MIFVPEEIIPDDHRPAARQGFHFGVARMRGENFSPATHYDQISNRAEINAACVLLAWLNVGDQHGHNQFLQELEEQADNRMVVSKRFMLIDMGMLFHSWKWNATTVAGIHERYVLPDHMARNASLDGMGAAIDELLSVPETAIRRSFDDFPEEWDIPEDEVEAAKARVVKTRERLREIIEAGNPKLKTTLE